MSMRTRKGWQWRLPGWDGKRCPVHPCLLNEGHRSEHFGCFGEDDRVGRWFAVEPPADTQGELAL